MALASQADVISRLGHPLADTDSVDFLLDAATEVIASAIEAPLPSPAPEVLRFVCVEVVCRALSNPDGLVSQTKTLGAYTHSQTHRGPGSDATSQLLLTKTEELMVRRAVGRTQTSQRVESHIDDVYGALVGS